ncbi:MAG: BREX-6 system BrxE protein [Polyangiaceae bacterium]|nr:BREX-6 system BrxE protein [Polyangiaceae bacterium]
MLAKMASKRAVLEALSRDDLHALVDAYDLAVSDRRKKDALIDALAASKKAHLDELLALLSRDPLKAICRHLGLNDSGKLKADIVERILGGARPQQQELAKSPVLSETSRSRPPEPPPRPSPAAPPGAPRAAATGPSNDALDRILALQFLVAWAGEGRSEPKRLGWWDTDLVDEAGGGDLLARLAPRTHLWASLELVRKAARRVDERARGKHGDPDKLRTLYFLGFDLDDRLNDRLAELKRQGRPPEAVLPLPFKLGADFDQDRLVELLSKAGSVSFEKVPPVGRRLEGSPPSSPEEMVNALAAALTPLGDEYPLPFFKAGS